MVVAEVVALVEVVAGVPARAHTDHAVPAEVKAEVSPHRKTVDMYREVLLVLVLQTILVTGVYLQMGWMSTLRMCHKCILARLQLFDTLSIKSLILKSEQLLGQLLPSLLNLGVFLDSFRRKISSVAPVRVPYLKGYQSEQPSRQKKRLTNIGATSGCRRNTIRTAFDAIAKSQWVVVFAENTSSKGLDCFYGTLGCPRRSYVDRCFQK